MKEWKLIGIGALVANVLMVGLLVAAFFIMKGTIDDKNKEVASLEEEVLQLQEKIASQDERVEEIVVDNVEMPVAEKKVKEQEVKEVAKAEEQAVKEVMKTEAQAIEPVDYKQKLLSLQPSLAEDYDYVYFLYEGWPPIETMYESMSNAEVTEQYEEAYQKADAILNKVYGMLKENLPASEFKQLQAEQRTWLQRLTESKEDRLAMGGSSATVDVAINAGYETKDRCVELMIKYFGFEDYYGN